MSLKVGDRVKLKRNNLTGKGNKDDSGFIVSVLYKPVDEYDYIVRFDTGGTEAFTKSMLEKQIKQLTKIL